jgi:hypothetical protein
MTTITESEFARIVAGIAEDRESIIKHNPLGSDEEILLWMLLSCLVSYLNLGDLDTPCFNGKPDAQTYRDAVQFVLTKRRSDNFDLENYLSKLQ